MSLPRIKTNHMSKEDLERLTQTQRTAFYLGVPKDLLEYSNNEYLTADTFRTYDFRLSFFEDNEGNKFSYAPLEQFEKAHALAHSNFKEKFIVINCYPYLFTTPKEGHRQDLYMHLLGCLANRMVKRQAPMHLDLAFLGTVEIPYGQQLQLRDDQILVWGPVHEKTTDFRLQETISFLYNFKSSTKILLTSVEKLSALFKKLHIDPKSPTEVFDIRTATEKTKAEPRKEKPGKPPKVSRVSAVPREVNI